MNKHKEKAIDTRNKIIDEFWSLMTETCVQKITVKDITSRIGINRSTFYLHFIDIFDLLDQEQDRLVAIWCEMTKDISLENNMSGMIQSFSNYYSTYGDQVFLLLIGKGDGVYEKRMKDIIYERMKFILMIDEDMEFSYMFEFYIEAIIGTLTKWYPERQTVPIENVIALMHKLIENGLHSFMYNGKID